MKSRSISLQKMIQPFSSVSTLSTVPTHELICTHLNHKIDWHIVHCFGSSHLPVVVLLPIRRLVGSAAAPSSVTVLRKPSGTGTLTKSLALDRECRSSWSKRWATLWNSRADLPCWLTALYPSLVSPFISHSLSATPPLLSALVSLQQHSCLS